MTECAYINMILNMPPVLNMLKFWIWRSSEYWRVLNMRALHSVLNMAKFWIWEGSQYASVTQRSEYARIWFVRVPNISSCRSSHQRCSVKKLFLEFSQNSQENTCARVSTEYDRVLNIKELHRVLNMPQCGWICLSGRLVCLKMSEFKINIWVCIMQYKARGHSARWWVLIERFWEIRIQNLVNDLRWKMERFGKIVIGFGYLCKKTSP